MSEQATDSSDLEGARRRPTPTIDLTATEVRDGLPADAAERVSAAASELKTEASRAGTADPLPQAESVPTTAESPALAGEAAAQGTPDTMQGAPAAEVPPTRAAEAAPSDHASGPAVAPPPRRGAPWAHTVSGAVGAALVVLVLLGLWATGAFAPAAPADDGRAALGARLAVLEGQLRDLSGRVGAPSADAKTLQDITNRLARLEAKAAQGGTPQDPNLTGRVAATETALKTLAADIAAVRRHTDEVAGAANDAAAKAAAAATAAQTAQAAAQSAAQGGGPDRKELDALAGRVAALEKANRAGQDAIAADLRGTRYAVAAVALHDAVDAGVPFSTELGIVKTFAGPNVDFTPLETFATTGIPRPQPFNRELADLGPAMLRIAEPANSEGSGFIEKLQANAERLVRIRRIEDAPGDDPATIIARIEVRATRMDISEVLAELAKLPPAVRAPAEGWIKKAQVRVAALALSRKLETEALTTLSRQEP